MTRPDELAEGLRKLLAARAAGESPDPLTPAEAADLEDLAALREGRIGLDDLDEATLDRLFASVGTCELAEFLVSSDATDPTGEGGGGIHPILRLLPHVLSLAAAAAVVAACWLLLRSGAEGDLAASRRFARSVRAAPDGGARPGDPAWRQVERTPLSTVLPDARAASRGGVEARFAEIRGAILLLGDERVASAVRIDGGPGFALTTYSAVAAACREAALRGEPAWLRARAFRSDAGASRIEDAGRCRVLAVDLRRDLALLELAGGDTDAQPPGPSLSIAGRPPEPGMDAYVLGAASGVEPWPVVATRVERVIAYPDERLLQAVSLHGAQVQLERTRVQALETAVRLGPGMIGGALVDAAGELIGLTLAAGRDTAVHAGAAEIRAFLGEIPPEPTLPPFDLWTAGGALWDVADVAVREAVVRSAASEPALLVRFRDLNADVPLARTLYLPPRGWRPPANAAEPLLPRGLPGMEDRGDFPVELLVHVQGHRIVLGRGDGERALELWADRDGDGLTDVRWTRTARGWTTARDRAPLLHGLSQEQRARLTEAWE